MAKKKSNRILFVLIGVALVLVVVAAVAKRQGWIGQPEAKEVTFDEVKRGDITEVVSASGKIQPAVEVTLSPDVSGEVTELTVEEGDSVREGDLLLRIRPDNYQSLVDRAVATLNTNRANLSQARATLAQSEARFRAAQASFERNQGLFDQKVISSADFERAEADYAVARKEVEAARQNVEAARYSVQSAQANVADARENLRKTAIYAPITGKVSKLSVEVGERIVGATQMAGTELMRLANLNNMEVRVDVNENDIVRVAQGDTADIDVDAYARLGRRFRGVVTAIANTANETVSADAVTEFEVRIRVLPASYADLAAERREPPFRPGMTAAVDIITERKSEVTMVPIGAVTTRPENDTLDVEDISAEDLQEVVFVVGDDEKVSKRVVQTGISDFDHIEIQDGLEPGERIVSGPFLMVSKRLEPGDAVRKMGREKGRSGSPDRG